MKLPNQKALQRALILCQLNEQALRLVSALKMDLAKFDNPSKDNDKIRTMLDRDWLVKQIERYSKLSRQLQIRQFARLNAAMELTTIKQPEVNTLYCFAPSISTALNEAGVVRFVGPSKNGKLLKFEFINYQNKEGAKFKYLILESPKNLQKIA